MGAIMTVSAVARALSRSKEKVRVWPYEAERQEPSPCEQRIARHGANSAGLLETLGARSAALDDERCPRTDRTARSRNVVQHQVVCDTLVYRYRTAYVAALRVEEFNPRIFQQHRRC